MKKFDPIQFINKFENKLKLSGYNEEAVHKFLLTAKNYATNEEYIQMIILGQLVLGDSFLDEIYGPKIQTNFLS